MQNTLTVPFQITNWHVKLPTVVRYLESNFIEQFLNEGKLMLSSFKRFWKHEDEQRGDDDEGKAHLRMNVGGMPFQGLMTMGSDAFVLSCSCLEDRSVMENFGYSGAFRINNTIGFAQAIARALPGFHGGTQGFCIYRDTKIIERKNLEIDLPQMPPQNADDAVRIFHKMNSIVWDAAALEPLFRKAVRYAAQNEYRFVWFSKLAQKEESFIVEAPEALEFCERVIDIPKSTEMQMMMAGAKVSMHSSLEDALKVNSEEDSG